MIILLLGLNFFSPNQPQTVDNVDLNRYIGKWYDIASYPAWFQRGCSCTTAEYGIVEGKKYISVINSCKKTRKGKTGFDVAKGKAFVVKGSGNAKLRVQFQWPFRGDYLVIGLADDYSWAVVGHPKRKYLWILSRTPVVSDKVYKDIIDLITAKGYDVSKLQKTDQGCN
jgi:apolipoprotein D and lipocalin family protein